MESINVTFDEKLTMTSEQSSSGLGKKLQASSQNIVELGIIKTKTSELISNPNNSKRDLLFMDACISGCICK